VCTKLESIAALLHCLSAESLAYGARRDVRAALTSHDLIEATTSGLRDYSNLLSGKARGGERRPGIVRSIRT
jgi:hypothetical protein